ncbi:MAG: ATP-dependent DNA helicase DinG [Pseudomonadales bacterium]
MLTDEIKQQIQAAYSRLLDSKGYVARYCQRRMVADIANTLGNIGVDADNNRTSDGHIAVIEAGTGTGKTVAYAVATLPLARALGKRLVIATATVALQEQIVLRDLPDLHEHSGLDFSFALAKGRRRYLCLSRLDQVLQSSGSTNHTLSLYDDEVFATDASDQALYESMLQKLGRGDWDGDRDNLAQEVEDRAWFKVSTDHVQCTGRQCSHFRNCYFYKAREQIHKVDCIVTNHDLVLADLMMGGGAVLPAPEDTIYVFDEGHHLPDKAINHFSSFLQVRTTQSWLEQVGPNLTQLTAEVGDIAGLPAGLRAMVDRVEDVIASLEEAMTTLGAFRDDAEIDGSDKRYRFTRGMVTEEVRTLAADIYGVVRKLAAQIEPIELALEDRLADADDAERESVEHWLPVVAAITSRLSGACALWQDYMTADPEAGPPHARWITFREPDDIIANASPVAVHQTLNELLWSRCFGAVVTSATLAVAGNFERFARRAGIGENNRFNALPSPFRFEQQATLRIPRMEVDPREADRHNEMIAALLPELLKDVQGGLVLFTSWRQMFRVTELLDSAFMSLVLSQGTFSKVEIVGRHKIQIDAGEQSIIFGLASFAEGIDLPGKYCDHVVIAKIPFAVPDDPVGATLSEWIESRGGNAFQEIMIPDAALRMVQACGRLLRTETDTGVISILDRRLVSQRYGSLLLNALPPFRREIA